jgi:Mrp family chromosome partitioning ATPase
VTSTNEPAMFIACWSAKGGQGTTVVAAHLALQLSQESGKGALLVDLAGDAPTVLGPPTPTAPGVSEWLLAAVWDPRAPLPTHKVTDRLSVVAHGDGPLDPFSAPELVQVLTNSGRHVVVDCGTAPEGTAAVVARGAHQSILVTRPCHLALRRAAQPGNLRPDGIVVVHEPGRVLTANDVSAAVGAPVVAELPLDPAVARLVDAGLLRGRPARSMHGLAAKVSGADPAPATAVFDHLGAAQRALDALGTPPPGADGPGVGAW